MPVQAPWKSWHCQKGGGGLTHAKIFWWICRSIPKTLLRHHSAQIMIIYPPKSEHFSPKIDHHQQLVNIYPKSNHSLPKMVIYALFTSKCCESHLRAFVVKSTRVPGLGQGGGVKPILAMPRFSRRLLHQPLPKPHTSKHLKAHSAPRVSDVF